jgi:uncharacterized membrane protein
MSTSAFNRLIFVLSLVGLLIAAYLWKMHATPSLIPCVKGGGCATVAASPWSQFPKGTGPPVAAWGTLGYLALAGLSFLRTLPSLLRFTPIFRALVIAGALFGTLASLGLTWLELFVIKAICAWCMGSQGLIVVILVVSIVDAVLGRRPVSAQSREVGS